MMHTGGRPYDEVEAEREFTEGGYDAFLSVDRGQEALILRKPTKRGQVSWAWKRESQVSVRYGYGPAILLSGGDEAPRHWALEGHVPSPIPLEVVLRHLPALAETGC